MAHPLIHPLIHQLIRNMTNLPRLALLAACLVVAGCEPSPPPPVIHHDMVTDLVAAGREPAEDGGEPGPARRASEVIVAEVTVPADAVAVLAGRLDRRQAKTENVAPVRFSLEADGEEIFSHSLRTAGPTVAFEQQVSLAHLAGQTARLELRRDPLPANGGRAFWHRATVEQRIELPRQTAEQGRSLVFVVVDTLRADHCSVYGYERRTTPFLEDLAAESVVFEEAYSPSSWTLPSTTSLLTGLQPPRHGATDGGPIDRSFETLAERFEGEGITTFAASANPLIEPGHEFDQGFETFVHLPWERAPEINGSFLDWLDERDGQRFFAYLHYIDPHDPYDAPPPGDRWTDPHYDGVFTDGSKTLNRLYKTVNWSLPPATAWDESDVEYLRDAYDGEILYWDTHFRSLAEELRRRGRWEDLVLIVTSDHGEEFTDHGMFKHGHQLFAESLHVPLLIRAPRRLPPGRHPGPVELRGIYRAATQLLRLGPPLRAGDLLARIRDSGESVEPPPVFSHTRVAVTPDNPYQRRTWSSVRRGPWLLIRGPDTEGEEPVVLLFDLRSDPGEDRDVSARHPEVARELRELLGAWLRAEIAGRKGKEPAALDELTLEKLRSLGYIQ